MNKKSIKLTLLSMIIGSLFSFQTVYADVSVVVVSAVGDDNREEVYLLEKDFEPEVVDSKRRLKFNNVLFKVYFGPEQLDSDKAIYRRECMLNSSKHYVQVSVFFGQDFLKAKPNHKVMVQNMVTANEDQVSLIELTKICKKRKDRYSPPRVVGLKKL